MDLNEHGPLLIVLACLAWHIWRVARFIRQGRWFRSLDPEQQAELVAFDPARERCHGRTVAGGQFVGAAIGLIVIAVLVIGGQAGWF